MKRQKNLTVVLTLSAGLLLSGIGLIAVSNSNARIILQSIYLLQVLYQAL
ncbi:MAG: hypothetical protein R2765_06920 [Ferruginibacter sp.]